MKHVSNTEIQNQNTKTKRKRATDETRTDTEIQNQNTKTKRKRATDETRMDTEIQNQNTKTKEKNTKEKRRSSRYSDGTLSQSDPSHIVAALRSSLGCIANCITSRLDVRKSIGFLQEETPFQQ